MTIIAALAPAVVSLVAIAALMWWCKEPMECARCAVNNELCDECLRDITDDSLGG